MTTANVMEIEQLRYPIEVRAEARWIADRTGAQYEDLQRIEAAVACTFFRRAIQPLLNMKVRIYSDATMGQIGYVYADGKLELIEPALSPAAVEALSTMDEMIAVEARRYGLTVTMHGTHAGTTP